MKLIRYEGIYTYNIGSNKLSDYELLTQYNPLFISNKIRLIEVFINDLYHLNQSHVTCCDARGVVSVSYPLDKLVFYIIEQKDRLQHYKETSDIKLTMVKRLLERYTHQEQKEVMAFMKSNGMYRANKTIDKLGKELYILSNNARIERNRERERNKLINKYKRSMGLI
ncbi:pathogenicity island protein [Macrococcus animalis]|uniref:pathogenicity island protein n=1 Tax=Macrococcus animalis TaxID=3395467 RepID=UPI0039BDBCBC